MNDDKIPDFYKPEYLSEAQSNMIKAIAEYHMYVAVDKAYSEYHEAVLNGVNLRIAYVAFMQACASVGYEGRKSRIMLDEEADAIFESHLKKYTQKG